ncbi:MAG: hypothetical protein IPM82_16210 [Saprospiraceae bacterium]|nr:hypothetical protein [Saprospiraceae bacterium]
MRQESFPNTNRLRDLSFGEKLSTQKAKTQKDKSWQSSVLQDPNLIKHVVVLMMENRSFDHVLGYLSLKDIRTFQNQVNTEGRLTPVETLRMENDYFNPDVNGLSQEIIRKFSVEEIL